MRLLSVLGFLFLSASAVAGQESGVGIFDPENNLLLARISPESVKGNGYFDVIYCGGGGVQLSACEGPTESIDKATLMDGWKDQVEDTLDRNYRNRISDSQDRIAGLQKKISTANAQKDNVLGQLDREIQEIDKALASPGLPSSERKRLQDARSAKKEQKAKAGQTFDLEIAHLSADLAEEEGDLKSLQAKLEKWTILYEDFQRSLDNALAGGRAVYLDIREQNGIVPAFFYLTQDHFIWDGRLYPEVVRGINGSYQQFQKTIPGGLGRRMLIWTYRVSDGYCRFTRPTLSSGGTNKITLEPILISPEDHWDERVKDAYGETKLVHVSAHQEYYVIDPIAGDAPLVYEAMARDLSLDGTRSSACDERTTRIYFHLSR